MRVSEKQEVKIDNLLQKIVDFFGGEEETRTPAPVTRPTPLAGAPRHQLEYFSMVSIKDFSINKKMAERVGFEPTVRRTYDGFQDRSVMTTSVSLHNCLMILPHRGSIVKCFKKKISFFICVAHCSELISVELTDNLCYN